MADPNRSLIAARLIAALTIVAAVAVLVVLLVRSSRDQTERTQPAPAALVPDPPAAPPSVPPAAPKPLPTLSRAEMIEAARAAAAAYAIGAPPPTEEGGLVGRQFRVTIPFGCGGDQSADTGRTSFWAFGRDRNSVKVSVRPEIWTDSAFVRELGGPVAFDAVEGFWIPRPWIASDDCPTQRTDPLQAAPPTPSPQTIGIAVFHEKGGSRLEQRRERPYELVVKAPQDGSDPAPGGYRLVLEGRVSGYDDRQAIRCRSESADQRPVCLIRVVVNRVAIRDPASGQLLGEWAVPS